MFAMMENAPYIAVVLVLAGWLPALAQDRPNKESAPSGASHIPISADPLPAPDHKGLVLKNFADHPLFGPNGPGQDDVLQGSAGDCFFLSQLAALAGTHPEFIRKTVNELEDGTYLVHFVRGRQPANIRVNADLWVDDSGKPKYAGFSANGPIWPAIIEKAFAACRRPPFGYGTIHGGNGETLCRLAVTKDVLHRGNSIDPQKVVDWFNAGAPDGPTREVISSDAIQLLSWIKARLDAGKAVIAGSVPGVSDNTPLRPPSDKKESTFRRGEHIYMVDHVVTDQQGSPLGLVLRDPFGKYRTVKDIVRICFCIGDPATLDIDRGFADGEISAPSTQRSAGALQR